MKLDPSELERIVAKLFDKLGCNSEEANCIAHHLVEANLAGHDSHGVIRVPIYHQWIKEKKLIPNQTLKIVLTTDALTVIDGQLGFGQWIGKLVTDIGIKKCLASGISLVALRNSGHLGRIGHYAEMAAREGLVSLHFVNSTGLGMMVAPIGGIDCRLSVNPVSVGIPIEGKSPVILDMAAAATAEGKIKVAKNKGVPVPEGWILTADGKPTTDPNEFYGERRGSILPFGGHKGYALALVAELLSGAVTGGGCSREGKTVLEQGMLSIFIDPKRLESGDNYFGEFSRYIDFVKTSRTVDPDGEILVPGDIEERNRTVRRQGLELDKTTWGQLAESAQAAGVEQEIIDAAVMAES